LLVDQQHVQIDSIVGRLEIGRKPFMPHLATKQFHHYVAADAAHECAKPLGMLDAFHSDYPQNPQQGLLPDIFDQWRGPDPSPQLQQQQVSKVGAEMMFHDCVTARQPSQIVVVERMELPRDLRGMDKGFPG